MKINEKTLDIALLLGAVIAVIMALASDFTARCEEKRDNAFRLHILANSDSAIDQQTKYEVRDYIINDLDFIFGSCKTNADILSQLSFRKRNYICFFAQLGYIYANHI